MRLELYAKRKRTNHYVAYNNGESEVKHSKTTHEVYFKIISNKPSEFNQVLMTIDYDFDIKSISWQYCISTIPYRNIINNSEIEKFNKLLEKYERINKINKINEIIK